MTERTVGYILLVVGILIMIYSTWQIITIVTGKAQPPHLIDYKTPESSISTDGLLGKLQGSSGSAIPMPQLFDPKALNDIINLSIFYLVMQFLLGLGYKFSSLGVSMLRPIVVQVKNKRLEQTVESESSTT